MTHFIGAVIVPATVDTAISTVSKQSFGQTYLDTTPNPALSAYLTYALSTFSEDYDLPPYQEYDRAGLIAKGRADDASYLESWIWKEWTADPVAYEAKSSNPSHVEYLKTGFPAKLARTDDEVYADGLKWYDPESIHEDGSVWTTSNPQGFWDWWVVGGRWTEEYADRQGETVAALRVKVWETLAALERGDQLRPAPRDPKDDLEDPERKLPWWFPTKFVHPDGEGFALAQQGKVGWFGWTAADQSETDWLMAIDALLANSDQDATVSYIDFHI